MTYSIHTHDSWGIVPVGSFDSLEEARQAFAALREDPWYRRDGTVRGLELVQMSEQGLQRLEWHALQPEQP